MQVKVCAKLNLTLNCFDKVNGYHQIDSITTTVNVCDTVTVTKRQDNFVNVSGVSGVPIQQNTAYKVATAFVSAFDTFGVDVVINKAIPTCAGMGGSSADASAVVYCMCQLFGVQLTNPVVHDICARVGSDINYLLYGGLARIYGKGDDMVLGKLPTPMHFVVTTFNTPMVTSTVYDTYDKVKSPNKCDNEYIWQQLNIGNYSVATSFANNLQQATTTISNYASGYASFCKTLGVTPCLTGSGSSYFVVCGSEQVANSICSKLTTNGFDSFVCHSTTQSIVE